MLTCVIISYKLRNSLVISMLQGFSFSNLLSFSRHGYINYLLGVSVVELACYYVELYMGVF